MSSIIRYGADSSASLDFAEGVLVGECGTPSGPLIEDLAVTLQRALSSPVSYPPLEQCTTPGDKIVVTLDEGMPQGGRIAAEVIRSLLAGGVHADGITVLRTAADATNGSGDPAPWLPDELSGQVALAVHDPDDRQSMAYLAASEKGEAILLNRLVTDADLVVPIGCVRHWSAAGYHGVHTPIFPAFSDRRTQLRFQSPTAIQPAGEEKKQFVQEADEVGWLLGVAFTIQVVPGPGDRLLYVLAGEVDEVRRRSEELYEAAWHFSLPRRASLVVAAIEGGPGQQSWDNVGRAVAAASELVEDGGAIAICSEVAARPGPAVTRLRTLEDRQAALRQFRRHRHADVLPATQLALALDRAGVYLLSRIDPTLVEDLQIAPITEPGELVRLTQRHSSCILLSNAPRTLVEIRDEGGKMRDER